MSNWSTNPTPVAQVEPPTSWYTDRPAQTETQAGAWHVRYVEKATVARGNGALVARAAPRVYVQADLSGSGAVGAATAKRASRSAQATGSGWLWANVYIAGSVLAQFAGHGQLSASTTADGLHSKAIQSSSPKTQAGGHGSLGSVVTNIKVFIPANLVGHGGLVGSFPLPAQLTGVGQLQAAVISGLSRMAQLSGHGVLIVVPNDGLHGTVAARSPTLEQGGGHGALSIKVSQLYQLPAQLHGKGKVQATISQRSYVNAMLTGAGALRGIQATPAQLTGAGSLQGAVIAGLSRIAQLTGRGLLVVVPNDGLHGVVQARSPSLEQGAGHGALSIKVAQIYQLTGQLHGYGAVHAAVSQRVYVNALLSGVGGLQVVQATPAELAGVGQLQATVAAGYGRVAALAGRGVLYAAPNDGLVGTVYALPNRTEVGTGHGQLSVAAVARYQRSAGLQGHGSVAATFKQICPVHPTPHGQGVVSAAARMYQLRVNAAATGRGALTAIVEQEYTRLAGLTGHGVLAAVARMYSIQEPAALAGRGSLAGSGYARYARTAATIGHGTLTAQARMYRTAVSAALAGRGALTATAVAQYPEAASTSGHGALSATARISEIASNPTPAGHGALTGSSYPKSAVVAQPAGTGALVTAWLQRYGVTATLHGRGRLVGQLTSIKQTVTAQLSGQGGLSGSLAMPGRLTGVGQLQAASAPGFARTGALAGQGALYTAPNDGLHAGVYPKPAAAEFGAGHGALGVKTSQIYKIPAQASGQGTLAAAARMSKINEAAHLIGSGQVSGTAIGQYLRSAGLSGHGALTALAHQIANSTGGLPGHGAMTATAIARYLKTATTAGHGVLSATATALMPSYDNVSAGASSTSSPASLSAGAFSVAGNLIVLAVGMYQAYACTAKVGTTNMINAGFLGNDNNTGDGGLSLFYLLNSGLTGSQNPTATWSGSKSPYVSMCAMSFKNVHNVTPGSTYGYASGAQSLGFSTVVGGILIGALDAYSFGNPPMSSFLGTQKYTLTQGSYVQMMLGYAVATATTTYMGATMSSSADYFSMIGLAIS